MLVEEIILLCLVGNAFVTGTTQLYTIENDRHANMSKEALYTCMTSSLESCAALCFNHFNCCSASYDNEFSCSLFSCCFPETVAFIGSKHIRQKPKAVTDVFPKDCSELPPGSDDGVYTIYPTDNLQVDVFCDIRSECGTGWTVVQRRMDGSVDFDVGWASYKSGFGDLNTEFWIGNDVLNLMTNSKRYILRFDMEDVNGITVYAEYNVFSVGDESTQYILSIGNYSGTAGDAAYNLDGMEFTTRDRDNDKHNTDNCAADSRKGAWWFKGCGQANPNGLYKAAGSYGHSCVHWKPFRWTDALMKMSMKIKPY